MTNLDRSQPNSSPPALRRGVREILVLAGAAIITVAVALFVLGLVLNLATPAQALAVGVIGFSLVAFGVGTGHELELPIDWPRPRQLSPAHRAPASVTAGSQRAEHAEAGAHA
jgi:hypothetical protein